MAEGIQARLRAGELRRFGLLVGGVFLALAAVLHWRGRPPLVVLAMAGLGGALLLSGLILPSILGPVYRGWTGLTRILSKVTTPVFMGVIYFLVITPVGIILRTFGHRPLERGRGGGPVWVERGETPTSNLERQF